MYSKKKILLTASVVFITVFANAQMKKFSPEKFMADQEQFIVEEACLTPQDAEKFFPLFEEMQSKERTVFDAMRKIDFIKPATEEGCMNAIREHDKLDMELKRIEQTYHNKFLKILPASKVYDIIQAEGKFHRRVLKRFAREKMDTNVNKR